MKTTKRKNAPRAKEPTPVQVFDKRTTLQKTHDGFQNFTSKLGISVPGDEKQNAVSDGTYDFNLVTRNRILLEAAYRGSWIVGQVVDAVAEDMTRAGIDLTTNEDAEKIPEVQTRMKRLQVWQSLSETVKWGRLYGGAIAVMQIRGQNPSKPIDLDSVQKDDFLGLAVYDRWQLAPVMTEVIKSGPDMGLPMYYDIVLGGKPFDPDEEKQEQEAGMMSNGRLRVHHSRCIRFIGIQLPYFQAITEWMWGESVLERMWDRLIMFDDATSNVTNLTQKALLRMVGVNGLREILAAGGDAQEALVAQFDMMRKLQVNEGVTLIDKEDEFASTAYSFAGLSDVMIQFGQQVSGACNIPLVRLFGQSPAGLSATGESDIRNYYDGINAKQEKDLRNPFEILVRVLWRSVTGNPAPKDLSFTFTPLWQMSATDKANVAKTNSETIISAHQEGLIDTATGMKELKQLSSASGLFSHITDEMVEEAEFEEPPQPQTSTPSGELAGEAGPDGNPKDMLASPAEKIKKAVGDAAAKIKAWLSQDAGNFKEGDHPRKSNGEFGKGSSKKKKKGTTTQTPPDVEMIPSDIFEPNLTEEQEANARARFRKPDDRPNPSTRTPEQQSERSHELETATRKRAGKDEDEAMTDHQKIKVWLGKK